MEERKTMSLGTSHVCRVCLAPFRSRVLCDDTCSNCRIGYAPASSQHEPGCEVEASRLLSLACCGKLTSKTRALYAEAAKLLHRAVKEDRNNSTVLCNLGALYEAGHGVERNVGCAVKVGVGAGVGVAVQFTLS